MAKRPGQKKGPQFVEYFGPVLEALRELGGSGRPVEVIDKIASAQEIPAELSEELPSGGTRFGKYIHWARFYLVKDGYIDSSKRGVWSLTEKGSDTAFLTHAEALDIFQKIHEKYKQDTTAHEEIQQTTVFDSEIDDEIALPEYSNHRVALLNRLRAMSSSAFERFCQMLLREAGFEQVEVTGRSGDGGIDGRGILKINQFVSFQVAFQSKKYGSQNSLGPEIVRDFRGAIVGRVDKGIILTTGAFTNDARREAKRDGAIPIELVDGQQLMDMLEELELGLKNKKSVVMGSV